MKRTYELEKLDCAVCAQKMEDAIKRIDKVSFAQVNFFTQKLTLEAEDGSFDEAVKEAAKVCRRIEPACRIKR